MLTFPLGFFKAIPEIGNGLKINQFSSQRVDLPNNTLVNFQKDSPFSLCFWVRLDSLSGYQQLYSSFLSASQIGIQCIIYPDNRIFFDYGINELPLQRISVSFAFSVGELYHIVATRSGNSANDMNIYVNGSLLSKTIVYNNTLSGTYSYTGNNYSIGSVYINPSRYYYFNGAIHDFKVYNFALSQSQINDLVNLVSVGYPIQSLVFDENSGTTAYDTSGNALHGTLVNYSAPETTVGASNKWVDKYGNPILS